MKIVWMVEQKHKDSCSKEWIPIEFFEARQYARSNAKAWQNRDINYKFRVRRYDDKR
jgi:hypothetical protein